MIFWAGRVLYYHTNNISKKAPWEIPLEAAAAVSVNKGWPVFSAILQRWAVCLLFHLLACKARECN